MLSKELFVKTLNFIEERDKKVDKINNLLQKEFEGELPFVYYKYENMVLEILREVMHDYGDIITYYMWEGNFGKDLKPTDVLDENDNPVDITSAEKLYDYLVMNYNRDSEK